MKSQLLLLKMRAVELSPFMQEMSPPSILPVPVCKEAAQFLGTGLNGKQGHRLRDTLLVIMTTNQNIYLFPQLCR